jgi:hypothetical protein
MIRLIYISLSLLILSSCGNGQHQKNMERLDELYGECKNPTRQLSKEKYKACLAKQRAGGESLFDLKGDINDLIAGRRDNVVIQNSVNPYLWRASLEMTSSYPLKIADNQGGYIETDWISSPENQNQRCLIKIRILSTELISTGVSSDFLCENKKLDTWVIDNQDYFEEEKQLTLQILKTASNLSNSVL